MQKPTLSMLEKVEATVRSIERRSQKQQNQLHLHIMMHQLVADDYVPALSPINVVNLLKAELGEASETTLRAFDIPEVTSATTTPTRDTHRACAHSHLRYS